jgi:two-component sensor histidine kinase
MPTGANKAKPGLGTGIVEALAKQLHGDIHMADAAPGVAFMLVQEAPGRDVRRLAAV